MSINKINGIGEKAIQKLNKLNIFSLEDLLNFYPYRYNFINLKNLAEINENDTVYIKVKIISVAKIAYIKRNFNILSFNALIDNNVIKVKIYNRAFMKSNLIVNKEIVLIGKYNILKNEFTANDIKFKIEDNTIEPIYHLTEGIKNQNLIKWINDALQINENLEDYVPMYLNEKYNFIDKKSAVYNIHKPRSIEDIKKAKLKLIYEEFFLYTFKINVLKINNQRQEGIKHVINLDKINEFLSEIPFKLTEDQLKTIDEILSDMSNKTRMNRLVLGDVGSGKTIVAMIAILANFYSGYQTTFMAPTEILAKQHFESISNFLSDTEIRIALLTGSMTKKNKEKIYNDVKENKVDLLIGTHALINEKLVFNNLGLVITDEQHLFGVKQRNSLQNKGNSLPPDVLYLSATPIPRTYALTIYGDLSLSIIKTKPKMRKEIITKLKKEKEIKDVLRSMVDELKNGHQIFVVSPLIEQNENYDLKSVYYLEEKLNIAFNNAVAVSTIHGKMKQKEKDDIMNRFAKGEIQVLISTTVIEVGIDIPNATMMVIFNAERFGLAALHQLRGRVGRNDLQSYCYLISDFDSQRLKVMEESSDGFYISEKDFELRGQGDLFGVKQSGDIAFKIGDIKKDGLILLQANKDSENFLKNNEYLNNEFYAKVYNDIIFLD